MFKNRKLVKVEGTKYFYYKGEKDDMIFIKSITKTGQIKYDAHIIDVELFDLELKGIIDKLGDVKYKSLTTIELYLQNKDKDLYRFVNYHPVENGWFESVTTINRPSNLSKASDQRCYASVGGGYHIFTKVTRQNSVVLEYFKLDPYVVKYSLPAYLNALQRNNRRERNAISVDFITDKEFFESTANKKMFSVKG